jgi:hypothetical protein
MWKEGIKLPFYAALNKKRTANLKKNFNYS